LQCTTFDKRTGETYSAFYFFSTFTLPFFTELHSKGYRKVDGKNVKVLPENIAELLTPRAWPIASREKVVMIKVEEQYG